jgi:hypothetical protein
MTRSLAFWTVAIALLTASNPVWAQPAFVNGLTFDGAMLDLTRQLEANQGRFGFFSDLYYDPVREEWWALSDRGPGGGTLSYETRLHRIAIRVHQVTGEISNVTVKETVKFTDPDGLLYPFSGTTNLDGLNPFALHGNAGLLGASFDPEGLVVDPHTGHFLVADEYGPSLYEFDRQGRLVRVFETPDNLIPKVGVLVNYVAPRDACSATVLPPFCGLNAGRQDNRGFEGVAITPDGKKLYAVLQDPLVNEPPPNNGRDGRTLRIVAFDNDQTSPTLGKSIAQYAYQLELQADVRARIIAAGGVATANDPRQGRNIGLSAILAVNQHEFLVLERDNRGIGVEDPRGVSVVGTKRIYKISIDDSTTDISAVALPADGDLGAAGITPVAKSAVWIDLALNTSLPNGKQVEKWEGMTIGPRLGDNALSLVVGNDNDYSVTQEAGTNLQSDIYVDFAGNFLKCPLDAQDTCQLNGTGPGDQTVPANFHLIPGVLHAYKIPASDLPDYVEPEKDPRNDEVEDDF